MSLLLPRLMSKMVKDEMVLLAAAVDPDMVFVADPDMEPDYKKHLEDADKENKSEFWYIRTFLKQFKEGDKLYQEAQSKISDIQKDIDEVEEELKTNSKQRVPMRLKIERLDADAKEIESDIGVDTKRKDEIQALIDADTGRLVELSNSQKTDKEAREYAQKIASLDAQRLQEEYTDTLNKKAALDSLKLIEGVKELDGKAKVFSDISEKEHKMLTYNKDDLAKFEDVKSAAQERKAADKSYLYTL